MEQPVPSSEYFAKRASEERHAASHAADDRAAQSHREMAEQYEKLARGDGGSEPLPDERCGGLPNEFRILP